MQNDEIKQLIEQGITGSVVMMDGDGTHFQAIVISDNFSGKNLVQRHQMVYQTLGTLVGKEIHALSIRAYTIEEWDRQKELGVLG